MSSPRTIVVTPGSSAEKMINSLRTKASGSTSPAPKQEKPTTVSTYIAK